MWITVYPQTLQDKNNCKKLFIFSNGINLTHLKDKFLTSNLKSVKIIRNSILTVRILKV